MEYVQEFIKILCESEELKDYDKIRIYLDEDYNSAEHFTVILYFGMQFGLHYDNSLHFTGTWQLIFFLKNC